MKENQLVASATMMTSVEIAEVASKRHCDVLRAIRVMESAWEKVNGRKFSSVEYTDAKGEKRPCYQLTKTECLYIATKFNDEARARLILRWEQLENEWRKPATAVSEQNTQLAGQNVTLAEALKIAHETIEEKEEKIKSQKSSIEKLLGELSRLDPSRRNYHQEVDYHFVADTLYEVMTVALRTDNQLHKLRDKVDILERAVKFEQKIAKEESKNESKKGDEK